jgi:hypothetical protein
MNNIPHGIAVKLSKLWPRTSRPAEMWTALGQLSVFKASTIPSVGFMSLLAIPVLKFMEVMSRMAVPVVSEPVPAVVGTGIKVGEVHWILSDQSIYQQLEVARFQ